MQDPDTLDKRDATPQQREYIAWLRSGAPDAVAHTAKAVHGIDLATYRCPTEGCGRPYEYPHSVCQGCRRPHQRACATSGCGEVIPRTDYGDVPPYCNKCQAGAGRQARAQSFARSGIGPRERMMAQAFPGAAPQQVEAMDVLTRWLDSAAWRPGSGFEPSIAAVYLCGRPGRGKSVLAAWTVHQAYVERGLVPAFRWHSQADLALLFSERHARDTDSSRHRAEQAANTWRAVLECPLLVVDDLFADRLTPAFGEALATLIRERLDNARPTVLTSNHKAQWQTFFEHDVGRLDSRWRGYGREVVIGGDDLRGWA